MKIGVTGSTRTTQNFVCFATDLSTGRAISNENDFPDPANLKRFLREYLKASKHFVWRQNP